MQRFEREKQEDGEKGQPFFHTNEKALVCVAGAPRSCILSSLQTFYHKLYITWVNSEWKSGQTTVTHSTTATDTHAVHAHACIDCVHFFVTLFLSL